MKRPPTIYITPIHQYAAETQRTLQHAVLFVVLIALSFGVAYQMTRIDRQMAIDARV